MNRFIRAALVLQAFALLRCVGVADEPATDSAAAQSQAVQLNAGMQFEYGAVGRTSAGLAAFTVGFNDRALYLAQPATGWTSLGGYLISEPVVARNPNGALEVFAVGGDHGLYHNWQTWSGAWSGWYALGGYVQPPFAVASNANGSLEVFVRGGDNQLWHIWQSPGTS